MDEIRKFYAEIYRRNNLIELQKRYDACKSYDERELIVDLAGMLLFDKELNEFNRFARCRRECEEYECKYE